AEGWGGGGGRGLGGGWGRGGRRGRGQAAPAARQREGRGGGVGARAQEDQVPEERAHCGDASRDGRRGKPCRPQLRNPALEVLGGRLRGGATEPVRERAKVAAVGVHRLGRAARREQGEEALGLRIGGRRTFMIRP